MKRIFTIAAVAAMCAVSANAEVLWEGNVQTGSWGSDDTSCVKVGKAAFATAIEGDVLEVTISEAGDEACMLYKNGENWGMLAGTAEVKPTGAMVDKLTLAQETVDELKAKGLILQGNNITITKVELTSSATFEYTNVWEGDKTIDWNGENAPRTTDPICAELKAGDIIAVTVSAIGEKSKCPQCTFRSAKDDADIANLQLWDFIGQSLPIVKSVVVDDPEQWKSGFYVVGQECSITKIEIGIKPAGDGDGDGDVTNEIILWQGEPTAMSWGAGPTVDATDAAKIKAGDIMNITVSSIADAATEKWPKVVCRCDDGWAEIFNVELWDDRSAGETFPLVKHVKVTEDMLAALAKGFNFGGCGTSIEKVTLTQLGTPTAVRNIEAVAEGETAIYNMQGLRVRAALNELPAGLYIVNGKKVLVK